MIDSPYISSFRTDKSKQDWKLELKISGKVPKIHIMRPLKGNMTGPIWQGRYAATLRSPFRFLAKTGESFPCYAALLEMLFDSQSRPS
jgi:hypothetical protein